MKFELVIRQESLGFFIFKLDWVEFVEKLMKVAGPFESRKEAIEWVNYLHGHMMFSEEVISVWGFGED